MAMLAPKRSALQHLIAIADKRGKVDRSFDDLKSDLGLTGNALTHLLESLRKVGLVSYTDHKVGNTHEYTHIRVDLDKALSEEADRLERTAMAEAIKDVWEGDIGTISVDDLPPIVQSTLSPVAPRTTMVSTIVRPIGGGRKAFRDGTDPQSHGSTAEGGPIEVTNVSHTHSYAAPKMVGHLGDITAWEEACRVPGCEEVREYQTKPAVRRPEYADEPQRAKPDVLINLDLIKALVDGAEEREKRAEAAQMAFDALVGAGMEDLAEEALKRVPEALTAFEREVIELVRRVR